MSDETAAKLRQMRDAVPDQSDALANSIVQIEDQIAELSEEAAALETEITDPNKADAIDLLENTIVIDKDADYVEYGPTFGTINWSPAGNLTDWEVIKLVEQPQPIPPLPPVPPIPTVVYTYTPGDYPDLDEWVDDYAFGNDYLTRPLINSGLGSEASYGIYPTIANMNTGKSYLDNNKSKIDASESVLSRYIP